MKYENVLAILSEVSTPISLYLMPINYEKEREKFFDSPIYNPQFRYRKSNKNRGVFERLHKLEEVLDVDPEISSYIIKVIEDKKLTSRLLSSIGDDDRFLKNSEERYGRPSRKLFLRACTLMRSSYGDISIAKRNEKLMARHLEYKDLELMFAKVFEILGLDGWMLDKSKAIVANGFRTAVKSKRIMVDPHISITAEKLRKTIVHEVVTHALRAKNGFESGCEIFGRPNLKEYLDDEEGLAMYNEELYGVLRDIDVRRRAALVYAVYLGQTMSFRQVFDALSSMYMKKNAFDITFRAKRGLSDTSQPGCYYRDTTYLRGFLKIRRKLDKDTTSYRNMYAGKIPLKYLYLVEEGILCKPAMVPSTELIEKLFKETKLTDR